MEKIVHKCPICEKELVISINNDWAEECNNGCYKLSFQHSSKVSIFGEEIKLIWPKNKDATDREAIEEFNHKLSERINYWREDYRYLAEILDRK